MHDNPYNKVRNLAPVQETFSLETRTTKSSSYNFTNVVTKYYSNSSTSSVKKEQNENNKESESSKTDVKK